MEIFNDFPINNSNVKKITKNDLRMYLVHPICYQKLPMMLTISTNLLLEIVCTYTKNTHDCKFKTYNLHSELRLESNKKGTAFTLKCTFLMYI